MKKIKINSFHFIETNDDESISKAQLDGLEIIDIPKNPLDYDDTLSDEVISEKIKNKDESNIRPERIAEVKKQETIESLNNKEVNK